jgi:hypothetical protein
LSPLAIGWADAVGGVSDAHPAAKVLLAIEPARETVRTALAAGFDPGGERGGAGQHPSGAGRPGAGTAGGALRHGIHGADQAAARHGGGAGTRRAGRNERGAGCWPTGATANFLIVVPAAPFSRRPL